MNKNSINLIVGLGVAVILLYFFEENTTLTVLALFGLGYLLFANNILGVA